MLRQAQHEDSYEDSVEKGVLILSLSKDEWPRWRRRAGSWAKPRPGSARDTIGRSVMRLQQSSLGSRALATRSRLAQTWGDPAKETFHDDGLARSRQHPHRQPRGGVALLPPYPGLAEGAAAALRLRRPLALLRRQGRGAS